MNPSPRRRTRVRVALCVLCLAACNSGSGGSPGNASVELLSAAYTELSGPAAPGAGDALTLYFSADLGLAAGKLLDAADLSLSAGSLGSPIGAPTLVDARAVRITLGTGASFVAGTATVQVGATQDALVPVLGGRVGASAVVTIRTADAERPSVDSLTVNQIPPELNGQGAAGGTLQLPRSGFTIDATYADPSSAVDAASLYLSSTGPVFVSGQTLVPGTNLVASLGGSPASTAATLSVPANVAFGDGAHSLTLTVTDTTGQGSNVRTLGFTVRPIATALQPFETSAQPSQVWHVDLSRDLESITASTSDGGTTLAFTVTATPNALGDFFDELRVLGLNTSTPIANVVGAKDSNAVALDLLETEVLVQLGLLTPGVNVSYTFASPGSFPAGSAQVPYANASFSRITVGGSSDTAGVLGLAFFDANNANQDDDTLHPGSTPPSGFRLGIFPHTLTAASANLVGSYFRTTFDDFLHLRGTRVGDDAGDATRLQNLVAGTAGDTRQSKIGTAIDRLARFVAVLVAHESGHSMGLVQNGAPPAGLYGGDSVHFPGATIGHISFTAGTVFPAGAQEVMSSALSFEKTNHASTAFNPLILAYLRERVLYGN